LETDQQNLFHSTFFERPIIIIYLSSKQVIIYCAGDHSIERGWKANSWG